MSEHPTITALRATAPHYMSPMPWRAAGQEGGCDVVGSDDMAVAIGCYTADAAHIAAAVNAAPHMLARVEELEGALAAQQEREDAAAARVGMTPLGCDTSHWLAEEILSLRAQLEALVGLVERWPELDCASWCSDLRCTCGAEDQNLARAAARLALGLEVTK